MIKLKSSTLSYLLIISTILFTYSPILGQDALISKGATWIYQDDGSTPQPQGDLHWYDLDYNTFEWGDGPAQIGYGDNDEATKINPVRTLYAIHIFDVADPTAYPQLSIDLLYDDGAIVYLNGQEVSRLNMPPGAVSYSTFASEVSSENQETRIVTEGNLQTGKNIIAVEVHQESTTSSDISFDLALGAFSRDAGFTESTLPLIFINTDGGSPVRNEPKTLANMKIVYNEDGSPNQVNATDYHFDGDIGIELRGQSSLALFPKKGYGFETWNDMQQDTSISFLGFPEESDWVIHSPFSDKTLIRNVLSYEMAGRIMKYAPRVKLCELFINEEYIGIIVLTEKIKRDKNRVDISKLTQDENEGDDLTGGYILKFDKGTSDEIAWTSPTNPIPGRGNTTKFLYHYPKPSNITNQQKTYIRNHITEVERSLNSFNYTDENEGYRKYLDVPSFIRLMIINEVTRNVDGYRLSTYMYKDKDSKGGLLTMGPVWDYNLAFGNADYCDGFKTSGWAYKFNQVCPQDNWVNHFWWERLLSDPRFKQELKDTYTFYRQNVLSNESIMGSIDSLISHMGTEAIDRNFEKWPVLGNYVWPNSYVGRSYEDNIDFFKSWIENRLLWLDQNIASFTTDIEKISDASPIQIYPNPTEGRMILEVDDPHEYAQVEVYTIEGALIMSGAFQSEINLSEIGPSGMYIVHVTSKAGVVYMDKVVVY